MLRSKLFAMAMLCLSASLMSGCGRSGSGAAQTVKKSGDTKVLNLYTWPDYLAPDTIATFEKQTGIKVRVSYFDTNETLEGRILSGSSGFGVVVSTAPCWKRQIRSGAYLPRDKTKLPNLGNLDPAIMGRVALNDPGNAYGVVYTWGTYVIGYNAKMVAEALAGAA